MKVEHRRPVNGWFAVPESDPVEPWYEAEVRQATGRAEREYASAQAKLAAADRKFAAAEKRLQTKSIRRAAKQAAQKEVRELKELITKRLDEIAEIQSIMFAPPVSSVDRKIRLRTGIDDHLELGKETIYQKPVFRSSVHKMVPGYVYILTNTAMPGYLKIGRSINHPELRARGLWSTGVPTPFDVVFSIFVSDHVTAEKRVHEFLVADRVSTRREFFRTSVEDAIAAVKTITALSPS